MHRMCRSHCSIILDTRQAVVCTRPAEDAFELRHRILRLGLLRLRRLGIKTEDICTLQSRLAAWCRGCRGLRRYWLRKHTWLRWLRKLSWRPLRWRRLSQLRRLRPLDTGWTCRQLRWRRQQHPRSSRILRWRRQSRLHHLRCWILDRLVVGVSYLLVLDRLVVGVRDRAHRHWVLDWLVNLLRLGCVQAEDIITSQRRQTMR